MSSLNPWERFAVVLALVVLATYLSRKFLTGKQQALLGTIVTVGHLV